MNIKESFLLAMKSMSSSKMRSFLTMLGIIIGVASVIILVSIVNGFSGQLTSSFESMGTNLLTVNIMARGTNRTVSPADMMELADSTDSISMMTPNVTVSGVTAKYGSTNATTSIYGTNEFYADIRKYEVQTGRFLGYIDVERRQKVCVIGTYLASELFEDAGATGKQLKLNGEVYTVVGELKKIQDGSENSMDNVVIIPYTAAMRLSRMGTVSSYYLSAASAAESADALKAVNSALTEKLGSSDYYRVSSQEETIEQVNELMGTLTTVLVGIAAISLLVGGIGIMNIMLVSVTERTKEIGIRKSLGGKRRDILGQFIIEAASTSAVGGLLGIGLGCGASLLVGNLMGLTANPTFSAVVISFSVSVTIGIIFGYYPAAKASKLNPIDALRYE